MDAKKKKQLVNAAVVVAAIALLYFFGVAGNRKSAQEQIDELNRRHEGAILFLKSGTEKDLPIKQALNEIRPNLAGKAGIVVADLNQTARKSGGPTGSLPVVIVVDAHGNEMCRFTGVVDRRMLDETVQRLISHHH